MKLRLFVLLGTPMFFLARGPSISSGNPEPPPSTHWEDLSADSLSIGGERVGALKLGDSRERALEFFPPKPGTDQEFSYGSVCGNTYHWVDLKNHPIGNIIVRFKDGKVFQIDSATTRFRTTEGITVLSSPQKVKSRFKGLRAYILSEGSSEATGGRPLIYWVDREKGMAFSFAYGKTDRIWYLFSIIVFRPNAEICPLYEPLSPTDKRELAPYSLEPN
jgi:hypothetical protein